MTLSLVINTFNQPDYLARVLAAVARHIAQQLRQGVFQRVAVARCH